MAHCGEYHIAQQEGNMKYVCKASEGRLVLFNAPVKDHLSMRDLCFCPASPRGFHCRWGECKSVASHLKKSSLLAHMYTHYVSEVPIGANSRVRSMNFPFALVMWCGWFSSSCASSYAHSKSAASLCSLATHR